MSDERDLYDDPEESELTDDDFTAADEVLRQMNAGDPGASRLRLAKTCHRRGESVFRLAHGLRTPANYREELFVARRLGSLSRDEYIRKLRKNLEDNLDVELLDAFFDGLQERIADFGEFWQVISELSNTKQSIDSIRRLEAQLPRRFRRFSRKLSFYGEEPAYLCGFAAEARVVKQQGTAHLAQFSESCYASMAITILGMGRRTWRTCQRGPWNPSGIAPAELFQRCCVDFLPQPGELSAMLEHEQAVSRVYLRESRSPVLEMANSLNRPSMSVQAQHVSVHVEDKTLTTHSHMPAKNAKHVLSVKHWSELAIGIDEVGFWALTPAPQIGEDFSMTKACRLPLCGRRWPPLLNLLAFSADGSSALRSEAMKILDTLPTPPGVPTDWRLRREGHHDAIRHELPNHRNAANAKLNRDLSDLAKLLRRLVDGPTGRTKCALFVEGNKVRSRFVVRALTRDSGHVRFGIKPL